MSSFQIPVPTAPFVDLKTGRVNRQWYQYLNNLQAAVGGGVTPVGSGGTGLSSGTSGGVLAFTGATTLASSAALTQFGPIYGGGVGGVPASMAAGSNGQLVVGQTGAAPLWKTLSGDATIVNTGVFTVKSVTGVVDGSDAAAGKVGEYISSTVATGASVALGTGVTSNITSIALTAGDWDVSGAIDFTFGGATSYTNLTGGSSVTSATLGAQDSGFDFETPAAVPTAGSDQIWVIPTVRYSLAAGATIFLVAQGTFTVSTLKAYGTIRARRIR